MIKDKSKKINVMQLAYTKAIEEKTRNKKEMIKNKISIQNPDKSASKK